MKIKTLLIAGIVGSIFTSGFAGTTVFAEKTIKEVKTVKKVNKKKVKKVAKTHIEIEHGDTLWNLANDYDVTVNDIVKIKKNKLDDEKSVIKPGDKLIIPGKKTEKTNSNISAPVQQTSTVAQTPAVTQAPAPVAPAQTPSYGNDLRGYVLGRMVAATGVPASTWDYIITRESRWQVTAQNPTSTAHGLFQSLWINGSNDVETQINDAIRLFRAQGMNPWAL